MSIGVMLPGQSSKCRAKLASREVEPEVRAEAHETIERPLLTSCQRPCAALRLRLARLLTPRRVRR
jgi:hypothetical protein